MYKRILSGALIAVTAMSLTACRNFLDVNTNPNIAQTVTADLLLPNAELTIASAVGVDLQINGSVWVQHFAQDYNAGQYKAYEQYAPTAANYDRVWSLLYSDALQDLKKMDSIAAKANLKQYQAISKLLTAYTYQVITDGWGDVPFTEALRGEESEGGIVSPRYDPQQQIYNNLLALVDEGIALIDEDDAKHPGADDLIYGGDMNHWRKFAYTLKLKMYMRLSERSPALAQAGIQALYATVENDPVGDFIQAYGDDAEIQYLTTPGNQNPLYAESNSLGNQNLVASATAADSLNSNQDPRRTKFFNTTTVVNGIRNGEFDPPGKPTYTAPGAATGALINSTTASGAPVKFLSSYESLLLQAEAVARGWVTDVPWKGRTEKEIFEEAIAANFEAYGLSTAQLNTYLANAYWGKYPTTGSVQQKIRHIITQKWFCMIGNQSFESWCEFRRTGYPDFLQVSLASRIGNNFPKRLLYPNDEFTTNGNFPGQKPITEPVWWDVN